MSDKEEFLQIMSAVKRDGIEELMKWLESTDFYEAPASSRYHSAYAGGLLKHSLNVYKQFKRLLTAYPEIECSEETAAIITLLHDACKINFYAPEKRNRKTADGRWEQYDSYTIKEKYPFGGHGSKSVYLIMHFMQLTPEEAAAINSHMGFSDNERVGQVYEHFPVAFLLNIADGAATFFDEA